MAEEKFTFQAEVSKLLDIVAHSLYSEKEIFLRELISNASDACERRRFLALTQPDLAPDGEYVVRLSVDKKAKALTLADNGIGMDHDDLIANLGTIARSGTPAFVDKLSSDDSGDLSAIGQFGVGFYSSFMVADKVDVLTRKAGEDKAWRWVSDGKGEFTILAADRENPGTSVILTLSKEAKEYLEKERIAHIVKTHSDHIGVSVVFAEDAADEPLNTASALWTRSKKEITDEQYRDFYQHVGHVFDAPWLTLHNQVEGKLSYTSLLFIPSMPPFDLFEAERKSRLKLYVNRVFITDDCEALLPPYLRFARGIVDSADLSLNISREMLQNDPRMAKIRSGLVKRVLGELKKKRDKEPAEFSTFWESFGAVLKEGIYEDTTQRDAILDLTLFSSTQSAEKTSLASYVERMKEGQEAIYYMTGEDIDHLARSPQLEGFKDRGIEVLLLTDPVDNFWVPAVGAFAEKPFKSASKSGTDLDKVKSTQSKDEAKAEDKTPSADMEGLISAFKEALAEDVKDVRVSQRLTDSPVCLVSDEGDMDLRLERMLKQHGRLPDGGAPTRILEINPGHGLIRQLAEKAKDNAGDKEGLSNAAHLLLDQARIVEGDQIPDPAGFASRLSAIMEKGLL